jgi:TFIIF-interacting CTD phosphatase-like protein
MEILLVGRSLAKMVLVDNKIESYALHIENGIPIKDYYGGKNDV